MSGTQSLTSSRCSTPLDIRARNSRLVGCLQLRIERGCRAQVRFLQRRWYIEAFLPRCLKCKCKEHREPTSGLEPLTCSLRVIIQVSQGFARACRYRIFKPISFSTLCVLHRIAFPEASEWCQESLGHASPVLVRVSFTHLSICH
jgi:hypothetical protein